MKKFRHRFFGPSSSSPQRHEPSNFGKALKSFVNGLRVYFYETLFLEQPLGEGQDFYFASANASPRRAFHSFEMPTFSVLVLQIPNN